jgi:hypothetical protein
MAVITESSLATPPMSCFASLTMHARVVHGAFAAADWEATSEAIADWAAAALDWDAAALARDADADAAAAGSGAEPVPVLEQAVAVRARAAARKRAACLGLAVMGVGP